MVSRPPRPAAPINESAIAAEPDATPRSVSSETKWTTTPLKAIAAPPMTTINVQKYPRADRFRCCRAADGRRRRARTGLPLAHEQRDQRHADGEDNGTHDQARGAPAGHADQRVNRGRVRHRADGAAGDHDREG